MKLTYTTSHRQGVDLKPLYVCAVPGCEEPRYRNRRQRLQFCHPHMRPVWTAEMKVRYQRRKQWDQWLLEAAHGGSLHEDDVLFTRFLDRHS